MPKVTITKISLMSESEGRKDFFAEGLIDGKTFAVVVSPATSDYGYEILPEGVLPDGDEDVQIAIGQAFEDQDIDVGVVGR